MGDKYIGIPPTTINTQAFPVWYISSEKPQWTPARDELQNT